MSQRIYIGNLPYSVTAETLSELFAPFGEVIDTHVVMDRQTGRPKGFAFIEMSDTEAAHTAISQLNGSQLADRTINVSEAQPRPERGNGAPRNRDEHSRQQRW